MTDFTTNDLASLVSGVAIMVFSYLVIKLYWRLANHVVFGKHLNDPAAWFAHGICIAFSAAAFNAFFWKFLYRLAQYFQSEGVINFVAYNGGYVDLIVSSMTVWAAFCHLHSAYLNLTTEARRQWSWYDVPWYPEGNRFTRAIQRMLSQVSKKE